MSRSSTIALRSVVVSPRSRANEVGALRLAWMIFVARRVGGLHERLDPRAVGTGRRRDARYVRHHPPHLDPSLIGPSVVAGAAKECLGRDHQVEEPVGRFGASAREHQPPQRHRGGRVGQARRRPAQVGPEPHHGLGVFAEEHAWPLNVDAAQPADHHRVVGAVEQRGAKVPDHPAR